MILPDEKLLHFIEIIKFINLREVPNSDLCWLHEPSVFGRTLEVTLALYTETHRQENKQLTPLQSDGIRFCVYNCLSVCVSVFLSVSLSVYLSICLSICLRVCLSVCLSICLYLSVCLTDYLSVSLSICLCV